MIWNDVFFVLQKKSILQRWACFRFDIMERRQAGNHHLEFPCETSANSIFARLKNQISDAMEKLRLGRVRVSQLLWRYNSSVPFFCGFLGGQGESLVHVT